MRITATQSDIIKSSILNHDASAQIYLFGSRTNDDLKGGDIDILAISEKIDFDRLIKIKLDLLKQLGDFPIDIVVKKSMDELFVQVIAEEMLPL